MDQSEEPTDVPIRIKYSVNDLAKGRREYFEENCLGTTYKLDKDTPFGNSFYSFHIKWDNVWDTFTYLRISLKIPVVITEPFNIHIFVPPSEGKVTMTGDIRLKDVTYRVKNGVCYKNGKEISNRKFRALSKKYMLQR